MQDTVAEKIHKAAQELLKGSASGQNLAEELNSTLRQFLVWPYQISAARITDSDGVTTNGFESVVYTSSQQPGSQPASVDVKAETVACVIRSVHTLTPEKLKEAYDDIRIAKELRKTPVPTTGYPDRDETLGIIFAIETIEPMETVAENMMLLNQSYPSASWPDMIVVLTRGTINYAMQFEGDSIRGDMLLPKAAPPGSRVFPMYLHVFLRSLGLYSFNRMCALLFGHLMIFSPGTKLPDMPTVLEGISQYGMTLSGYQFNLKSEIVPVPEEMYRDNGVGLNPRVEIGANAHLEGVYICARHTHYPSKRDKTETVNSSLRTTRLPHGSIGSECWS